MGTFIIINLADPSGMGAISSLTTGVTAKRRRTGIKKKIFGQNTVETIDAFDLLDKDLRGVLKNEDVEELREKCRVAKKIYLATHGTATDTEHAFAAASGGTSLCTYRQLGKFILKIFPIRSKTYNLGLIMCYGGRTSNYLTVNLDHQGQIPANSLKTSFAYKFFREICTYRKVRMTARTGAVAFNSQTGQSMVEQEVSIDARVQKEEFLRGPDITPKVEAWQAERKKHGMITTDWDTWQALNKKFKDSSTLPAQNDLERIIKDYQDIIRTKMIYQDVMETNQDLAKYGKIVYIYDSYGLTIVNKYGKPPDIPPGYILYQGRVLV